MKAELVNSKPARWWALLGLVLVPLLVAGGFLFAGVNSADRLHTVQAAVVNLDEPVTLDGQYTPLGRQLTANLVDSNRQENFTWVLASEEDARAGLTTGEFAAMVIIPENFSAAATSFSENDGDAAQQATIQVHTSPVAGVADGTLGKIVAAEATATLNQMLTKAYLEQIYVGFNDMGDQFVTLADGSNELADGAEKLADGIGEAADGAGELYTGARKLADGMAEMKTQTKSMPKDVRKLADGVGDYVSGVNQLVDQSAAGQQTMISTVGQFETGATSLNEGLKTMKSTLQGQAAQADQAAQAVQGGQLPVTTACPSMTSSQVVECIVSLQTTKEVLTQVADKLGSANNNQSLIGGSTALATGLGTFKSSLQSAATDEATQKQLAALKSGGKELAGGTDKLADGMPKLTDGIAQAADGTDQLADGVDEFRAGLIDAHSGSTKLADGMRKMADGIADGKDKLPSYSASDRESLATVVAEPVSTESIAGLADVNIGWISLVLVLALWLGALATYTVVKAVSSGLLNSSEATWVLIGRALLPGVIVVGIQALVIAGLAQFGLDLSWQKWLAVTGVLLLGGLTFVVINHALASWFGGIGRLISVAVAVLTTADALSAASPGVIAALRPFSPLSPALDAIRAIVTESSGATIQVLLLVGWLLLALVASSVAIARRRTTTLDALLAAG